MKADERRSEVHARADDGCRQHGADSCEKPDREFLAREVVQVEQEGAGEEQQREKAVEDEALVVDPEKRVDGPVVSAAGRRGR